MPHVYVSCYGPDKHGLHHRTCFSDGGCPACGCPYKDDGKTIPNFSKAVSHLWDDASSFRYRWHQSYIQQVIQVGTPVFSKYRLKGFNIWFLGKLLTDDTDNLIIGDRMGKINHDAVEKQEVDIDVEVFYQVRSDNPVRISGSSGQSSQWQKNSSFYPRGILRTHLCCQG